MKKVCAALVLALLFSTAACDLRLTARRATVRLLGNKIALVLPKDGRIHGGEVVIALENYAPTKCQFVLVRTPLHLASLSDTILKAQSTNENRSVVFVGAPMRGAVQSLVGIIPVTIPSKQTLHVFLRPGATYLLFNRLAPRRGLELQLQPLR